MRTFSALLLSSPLCLLLIGCALTSTAPSGPLPGAAFSGTVHGGQQPVAGAHVYLMAAAATGYGQPSVSLLNAVSTTHSDSTGAYVPSDAGGNFTITGDYLCTPGTQVYLYVHGGDPGSGENSAVGLMSVLGACPVAGTFALTNPQVTVNEVTTVAAAFALAGFATDATHIASSGTPQALTGIANAFLNAGNLVENVNGTALATTPAGNGTIPQAEINLIGNILAACINSAGPSSTACSTLFSNELQDGATGVQPADVASAAINLAHYPHLNIANLYAIPMPSPPFAPALGYQPQDFTIAVRFTGGGVAANDGYGKNIAIDGDGNVWQAAASGVTAKLSSLGVPISPSGGFGTPLGGGGANILIDETGDAYALTADLPQEIFKWAPDGTIVSPAGGFTLGDSSTIDISYLAFDPAGNLWGINQFKNGGIGFAEFSESGIPLYEGAAESALNNPSSFAIDSSSHIWVGDGGEVSEFSLSGTVLSPAGGYAQNGVSHPYEIAFDHAGDVWLSNSGPSISELSPAGTELSPTSGYTANGYFDDLAIDGAGNVFLPNGNSSYGGLIEMNNSGTVVSVLSGYESGFYSGDLQITSVALDASGDAWCTNVNAGFGFPANVVEFIGVSTPVVVPLARGIRTGTLGQRP